MGAFLALDEAQGLYHIYTTELRSDDHSSVFFRFSDIWFCYSLMAGAIGEVSYYKISNMRY